MAETPKPKLPETITVFRYPANWTLLLAFIAGAVIVTATFVVLARILPDDITEGLTDA